MNRGLTSTATVTVNAPVGNFWQGMLDTLKGLLEK